MAKSTSHAHINVVSTIPVCNTLNSESVSDTLDPNGQKQTD